MRESLEKWGPEVRSQWTNFPSPQYDKAFVEKLATQSEQRSEKMTVAEVERKRDECLVAVLQGLRDVGYGAGESFKEWEQALHAQADR